MPLMVRCDELQPGMRLAEALIANDGRVLLSGGKTLNHADVDILRRRYPDLCVRVVDPILDELIEFEDDSYEHHVAQTAQGKIAHVMAEVGERFTQQASLASVHFTTVYSTVAEVLEYLKAHPVSAALLARSLDPDTYLSQHTGNVFYLSMILGAAVRDYVVAERARQTKARTLQRDLSLNTTPLGVGAMFSDIGMVPLQDLFKTDEPLTEWDRQAIREHPLAGAEMLPEEFSAAAKMVVRTHHENFDGTGYPEGRTGNDIHIFTRIVRIADAYDAATATHVYKAAKSAARALWEMSVGPYSRFYDPVLMKVFSRLIQPFPIGAKIRLRDGRFAVVVRYNRVNPFLPTVIIAFDQHDQRLPHSALQPPFSLEERRELRIQSFAGEDLSFIYSTQAEIDPAPSRTDILDLFSAAFP